MSITMVRSATVTRPTTTRLKSSVLDHATVVTKGQNEGFGIQNDEGLWPSYNCLDTLVPTPFCPDPMEGTKTPGIAEWVPAFTFAYYGAVQCKLVGLDKADMEAELKRVSEINEGRGVEMALLLNRFVASDSDAETMHGKPVGWDAPIDVTPANPVSPRVALALLEGYAAQNYAGVPTIHMPRAVASLLGGDAIVWEDGKAFTRTGAKVAMGGGYDAENPTGDWEMFATGEVYVERSSEVSISSYDLTGTPGVTSDDTDIESNTMMALTERMYRVAVDCFVAKVTATVPAITGEGFGN